MAEERPGPSRGPERLVRELRRLLTEVTHAVDAVVAHPHPPPSSLHRVHREMRRLRTGLAIWKQLLRSRDRARLQPLDLRIRRLARLVGRIRDRDVEASLIETAGERPQRRREALRWDRYRARLRDDSRTGRELLRAFFRAERNARLFDEVGETLRARTRRVVPADVRRLLLRQEAQERKKLVSAFRKARRRPTTNRLHRLRIQVRRLRQLSDLAMSVDPDASGIVATSLKRLQQHLGRLHDLDVLIGDLGPKLNKTRRGDSLRRQRRREWRAILVALKATRPGRKPADPPARKSP